MCDRRVFAILRGRVEKDLIKGNRRGLWLKWLRRCDIRLHFKLLKTGFMVHCFVPHFKFIFVQNSALKQNANNLLT